MFIFPRESRNLHGLSPWRFLCKYCVKIPAYMLEKFTPKSKLTRIQAGASMYILLLANRSIR